MDHGVPRLGSTAQQPCRPPCCVTQQQRLIQHWPMSNIPVQAMSNITGCLTSQDVRHHRMSNITGCLTSQDVRHHRMSDITGCPTSKDVQHHRMSNIAWTWVSIPLEMQGVHSDDGQHIKYQLCIHPSHSILPLGGQAVRRNQAAA